nr:MAG TPA: hypothetical protein [Caudoviricetes sp.]
MICFRRGSGDLPLRGFAPEGSKIFWIFEV